MFQGMVQTYIHVDIIDLQGQIIHSIIYTHHPSASEISAAIQFRLHTRHITFLNQNHSSLPDFLPPLSESSHYTATEVPAFLICPHCLESIDPATDHPLPLLQEWWDHTQGGILASYHPHCWFHCSIPQPTQHSIYHLHIQTPDRLPQTPPIYHSYSEPPTVKDS